MNVGADQISLTLYLQDAQVSRIKIDSKRTTMAAKVLEGKKPEEACKLLPLLFSLCGTAQLQAGLNAFEQALGYIPSPATITARKMQLSCEGISEHLTRILVDWVELTDLECEVTQVRNLRALLGSIKQTILGEGGNDCIGGGSLSTDRPLLDSQIKTLKDKVETLIFATGTDSFLSMASAESFMSWVNAAQTIPARCLKYWQQDKHFLTSWPEVSPLEGLPADLLQKEMDGEKADSFIAKPHIKGQPCETGPFARQLQRDLIKDMVNQYGYSPISRFAAKLVDLALLVEELEKLAAKPQEETDLFHTKALHDGLGLVEAVRGQLCHRVTLDPETDTIRRYRILAPTEWNFHPDGPLKQALTGMDVTGLKEIQQYARLAVLALDPCVASEIVIKDA